MDILNKPIQSFKFEDVVSFCEKMYREGTQIDYKRDYSDKGLARHIVALSNSRGGVIIIGVDEDRKTGFPKSWDGIDIDAKLIEKLHQEIANIEPFPSCVVHATDLKNGKFFILVRIFAGDNTPYYVQNDSNVYVRTGNITKPIDIASPDGLELMFGKREKAEKARKIYLSMADEIYDVKIIKEENRIIRESREAKEEIIFKNRRFILAGISVCEVTIQPFFPDKAIAKPKEIKDGIDEIRFRNGNFNFPELNVEPSPKGIAYFSFFKHNKLVEFQQVFGQGLIQNRFTVSVLDKDSGFKIVSLWRVAVRIFGVLQFAKKFYNKYSYSGVLLGRVNLTGLNDAFIRKLKPAGREFWGEDKECLLDEYGWNIKTDTSILNNDEGLKKYFIDLLREIYWDLGFEDIREDVIDDFLKQSGLSF
jgi:hypothetical protein